MTETTIRPFDLIVGEAGGEIFNGDVPVRWCITPELIKDMENAGIDDPHILLISYKKGTDIVMDRKLLPITEIMTYVRFTSAGEQTLAGWIVSHVDGRITLKNTFLKKDNDLTEFYYDEEANSHEMRPRATLKGFSYTHRHITVNIPAEAFGKEPPAWLKWFGNLWHDRRPVDQCSFRRRLILAFTLKWIPMLAWILTSTVTKIGLTLGVFLAGCVRAVDYRSLLHPFNGSISYFLDRDKLTFSPHPFQFRKYWDPDSKYLNRQDFWILTPFIPGFMLIILFVSWVVTNGVVAPMFFSLMGIALFLAAIYDVASAAINYISTSHVGTKIAKRWRQFDMYMADNNYWPNALIGLVVFLVVGFFYLLITSTIFQIVLGVLVSMIALVVGTFLLSEHMTQSALEKNDYTQIRELLCPRDPLNSEAKYELVPPKQRTVHLWVAKVKNAVCKPMQY